MGSASDLSRPRADVGGMRGSSVSSRSPLGLATASSLPALPGPSLDSVQLEILPRLTALRERESIAPGTAPAQVADLRRVSSRYLRKKPLASRHFTSTSAAQTPPVRLIRPVAKCPSKTTLKPERIQRSAIPAASSSALRPLESAPPPPRGSDLTRRSSFPAITSPPRETCQTTAGSDPVRSHQTKPPPPTRSGSSGRWPRPLPQPIPIRRRREASISPGGSATDWRGAALFQPETGRRGALEGRRVARGVLVQIGGPVALQSGKACVLVDNSKAWVPVDNSDSRSQTGWRLRRACVAQDCIGHRVEGARFPDQKANTCCPGASEHVPGGLRQTAHVTLPSSSSSSSSPSCLASHASKKNWNQQQWQCFPDPHPPPAVFADSMVNATECSTSPPLLSPPTTPPPPSSISDPRMLRHENHLAHVHLVEDLSPLHRLAQGHERNMRSVSPKLWNSACDLEASLLPYSSVLASFDVYQTSIQDALDERHRAAPASRAGREKDLLQLVLVFCSCANASGNRAVGGRGSAASNSWSAPGQLLAHSYQSLRLRLLEGEDALRTEYLPIWIL
ncbi:unnamed protein product [Diplocarpon coronariae]